MNAKNVILDTDSTTLDNAVITVNNFNHLFGTSFTPYHIKHYGFLISKAMELEKGLTEKAAFELIYSAEILADAVPTPFAVEFVETLHEYGYKTPISTSRPTNQRGTTIASYDKYFPGLINRIFLREEQQKKHESKLNSIRICEPKAVIDDDAPMIWEIAHSPFCQNIIFIVVDQPWNRNFASVTWEGVYLKNNAFVIRVGDYTKGSWEWRNYRWGLMLKILENTNLGN